MIGWFHYSNPEFDGFNLLEIHPAAQFAHKGSLLHAGEKCESFVLGAFLIGRERIMARDTWDRDDSKRAAVELEL